MTIHGLFDLLRAACPHALRPWHGPCATTLGDVTAATASNTPFANGVAAIDTASRVYRYVCAGAAAPAVGRALVEEAQAMAAEFGARPVFVFDGPSSTHKAPTLKKRSATLKRAQASWERRGGTRIKEVVVGGERQIHLVTQAAPRDMKPNSADYDAAWSALTAAGFACYMGLHDGEALCAQLVAEGTADFVLTEDGDALAFGAPRVLFKYEREGRLNRQGNRGEWVEVAAVCAGLRLPLPAFQALCTLSGNDYCGNLPGIGGTRALPWLQACCSTLPAEEGRVQVWGHSALGHALALTPPHPQLSKVSQEQLNAMHADLARVGDGIFACRFGELTRPRDAAVRCVRTLRPAPPPSFALRGMTPPPPPVAASRNTAACDGTNSNNSRNSGNRSPATADTVVASEPDSPEPAYKRARTDDGVLLC